MNYLATDIVTSYEENIKQHYVEYVERFVNVLYQKKKIVSSLSKDDFSAFVNKLKKVKKDILNKEPKIDEKVQPHLNKIISLREFEKNKDEEDTNVMYDIKCHPQDYLPCMVYMMKYVERAGASVFNVFPLRTNIAPKYIRIDTTTIINLLVSKENLGTKMSFLHRDPEKFKKKMQECYQRKKKEQQRKREEEENNNKEEEKQEEEKEEHQRKQQEALKPREEEQEQQEKSKKRKTTEEKETKENSKRQKTQEQKHDIEKQKKTRKEEKQIKKVKQRSKQEEEKPKKRRRKARKKKRR